MKMELPENLSHDYCINPSCSCQDARRTFVRVEDEPRRNPGKTFSGPTVFYNYVRDLMQLDDSCADSEEAIAHDLLEALQSAQPDLDAVVARRHCQLRYLFRRARGIREQMAAPRPVGQPKVGRNDPCPCGSGKKFKKCCGAASSQS